MQIFSIQCIYLYVELIIDWDILRPVCKFRTIYVIQLPAPVFKIKVCTRSLTQLLRRDSAAEKRCEGRDFNHACGGELGRFL